MDSKYVWTFFVYKSSWKKGKDNTMINIRELYHNYKEYADKEVTIGGWLRSKRDSKTFGFLVVDDGASFEPLPVV